MPERRGPLASFEAAATADGYRECERCGVWVHPRSAPPFKCGQDCDTPGSEAAWLREEATVVSPSHCAGCGRRRGQRCVCDQIEPTTPTHEGPPDHIPAPGR